jgi:hypothetical protein
MAFSASPAGVRWQLPLRRDQVKSADRAAGDPAPPYSAANTLSVTATAGELAPIHVENRTDVR